jgi:hypothetical protein
MDIVSIKRFLEVVPTRSDNLSSNVLQPRTHNRVCGVALMTLIASMSPGNAIKVVTMNSSMVRLIYSVVVRLLVGSDRRGETKPLGIDLLFSVRCCRRATTHVSPTHEWWAICCLAMKQWIPKSMTFLLLTTALTTAIIRVRHEVCLMTIDLD